MPARTIPQTPADFFLDKLTKLPSGARLVVALDPERYLDLGDELTDPGGTAWRVFHYQNDDLAFRAKYAKIGSTEPHIVWITRREYDTPGKIELSYIADVLARAEDIVDLSLAGILKRMQPRETWRAGTLAPFAPIISSNLPRFIEAYRDLRQLIGRDTPLSAQHLRVMSVAASQIELDVKELLFDESAVDQVLRRYLRLAWTRDWTDESGLILRELARGSRADTTPIAAWLNADPQELGLYVFLRALATRYRLSNSVNQLRGLRLLSIDPSELETHAGIAVGLLEDKAIATAVEQSAETRLTENNLTELVKVFVPGTLDDLRIALREETAPALVFALAVRFLSMGAETQVLGNTLRQWQPRVVPLSATPSKRFTTLAENALDAIERLAFIEKTLAVEPNLANDSSLLLDAYLQSNAFSLELAHARARHALKALPDASLGPKLKPYLDEQHNRIRTRLEKIDLKLAELITQDWRAFMNHPRLAINVLRETVVRPLHGVARKPRVWILIFDGMRWDTWAEVVRPALSEHFECSNEKAYFCALPSFTDIARVSLLAGHLPTVWKGYRNEPTSDHNILAARLLGLSNAERKDKIRIIVSSETDIGQQKLDRDVKPFNVLIYNLSDDWIHHFRDDVRELNETLARKIVDGILPDLLNRIEEGDLVVVTSDHGFIELRERDQISIKATRDWNNYAEDDPRNPVVYRYLHNIEHPGGFRVQYKDDFYAVAKGQQWFQRERGRFSRYAHGGISMAEMVVPGVVLKRIVVPEIKFDLELPRAVEAPEREEMVVTAMLRNSGNRAGKFAVTITSNAGESRKIEDRLPAKSERAIEFRFTPQGKQPIALNYQVTYRDVQNREQRLPPQVLPITVKLRKDVVELGGLDALDRLIQE